MYYFCKKKVKSTSVVKITLLQGILGGFCPHYKGQKHSWQRTECKKCTFFLYNMLAIFLCILSGLPAGFIDSCYLLYLTNQWLSHTFLEFLTKWINCIGRNEVRTLQARLYVIFCYDKWQRSWQCQQGCLRTSRSHNFFALFSILKDKLEIKVNIWEPWSQHG